MVCCQLEVAVSNALKASRRTQLETPASLKTQLLLLSLAVVVWLNQSNSALSFRKLLALSLARLLSPRMISTATITLARTCLLLWSLAVLAAMFGMSSFTTSLITTNESCSAGSDVGCFEGNCIILA